MSFESHQKMALRVIKSVMDQPFMQHPRSVDSESDIGRFENALKAMQLIKEYKIKGELAGRFYLQFANWLSRKGQRQLSLECFDNSVSEFERIELSENAKPLYSSAKLGLAQSYTEAGDFEAAEDLITSVISMISLWPNSEELELPIALNNLACLQMERKQFELAEQTLLDALQKTRQTTDLYFSLQNNLAEVYSRTSRFAEARAIHQSQLLRLETETQLSEHDPRYLASLNNLGLACRNLGELTEAEKHFSHCISLRKNIHTDNHPDLFFVLNNLAELYLVSGRSEAAVPLANQLLNLCRGELSGNHALFLVCAKVQASIAISKESFAEAVNWLELASNAGTLAHGPHSSEVADCQFLLANAYLLLQEPELANSAFQRTLSILQALSSTELTMRNRLTCLECSLRLSSERDNLEQILSDLIESSRLTGIQSCVQNAKAMRELIGRPPTPPYSFSKKIFNTIATLLSNTSPESYAEALLEASNHAYEHEDFESSLELAKSSLEVVQQHFGVHDDRTLSALREFAYLQYTCGQFSSSAESFDRFLQLSRGKQSELDRITDLETLSIIHRKLNDTANYAKAINAAADIASRVFCEPSMRHAEILNVAGLALIRTNDFLKAEALLEQAMAIYKKLDKPQATVAFHCRLNLALLSRSRNDFEMALKRYNSIAPEILTHLGEDDLSYAVCLGGTAETHRLMGEFEKARPLFQQSLKLLHSNFGSGNALTQSIQEMYDKMA